MFKLSVDEALARLGGDDPSWTVLRTEGAVEIGIYRPDRTDSQTPHDRDEIYVVASGSGFFEEGGDRRPFGTGDLIFVKAMRSHRFVEFTADFSAWVIFV